MLRLAVSRRYVGLTALALVGAALFIRLGFWQLDRHAERKAFNAHLAAALSSDPVPIDEVVPPGVVDVPPEVEWTPVVVAGFYRSEGEVLLRSRTHEGQAGFHVLTPLLTDDGDVVWVNRGWVPLTMDTPPVPASPPSGMVRVVGYVRLDQDPSRFGPSDPPDGVVRTLAWADLDRIGAMLPALVEDVDAQRGVWVQLAEQDPPQSGGLPIPAPPPAIDAGPHLSYAIQWFAFAAIALGGLVALLHTRAAREDAARRGDAGSADDTLGDAASSAGTTS